MAPFVLLVFEVIVIVILTSMVECLSEVFDHVVYGSCFYAVHFHK